MTFKKSYRFGGKSVRFFAPVVIIRFYRRSKKMKKKTPQTNGEKRRGH